MRVRVSEASGIVLDYLVTQALGFDVYHNECLDGCRREGFWVSGFYPGDLNRWVPLNVLGYSTSWALGGPIIEREKIATKFWQSEGSWVADVKGGFFEQRGPTPLIAAMRCLCLAKLGEEAEVPEELCE